MTSLVFCQLLLLYHFLHHFEFPFIYLKAGAILCPLHGCKVLLWNANEAMIERFSLMKGCCVRGDSVKTSPRGDVVRSRPGLVTHCRWSTRTCGGCSRTRCWAPNSSAIHDLQTLQAVVWAGVLTLNHTYYKSWILIPNTLQLSTFFHHFKDIAYSFLEIIFLSI